MKLKQGQKNSFGGSLVEAALVVCCIALISVVAVRQAVLPQLGHLLPPPQNFRGNMVTLPASLAARRMVVLGEPVKDFVPQGQAEAGKVSCGPKIKLQQGQKSLFGGTLGDAALLVCCIALISVAAAQSVGNATTEPLYQAAGALQDRGLPSGDEEQCEGEDPDPDNRSPENGPALAEPVSASTRKFVHLWRTIL